MKRMIETSWRGWMARSARFVVLGLVFGALTACGGRLSHPLGGGRPAAAQAPAIGVNAYLWRATLDTLAFMPLASADPYGGVIITDWYINPEKTDERLKVTVYILDSRLRADGLSVTVFKEVNNGSGAWMTSPTSDQTSTDVENAILTRARQLRLSNLKG
jgi:hypothetical protein